MLQIATVCFIFQLIIQVRSPPEKLSRACRDISCSCIPANTNVQFCYFTKWAEKGIPVIPNAFLFGRNWLKFVVKAS